MTKPAPEALADFLTEYRRDNVTSVSCANLFDAAADMLRTQSTEVSNWTDTAALNQRNTDFYRGIVVEIGEPFGAEAKTADDGSICDDVLALKVPELVRTQTERVRELEAFVIAEGECHVSDTTIKKLEEACRLLLSGVHGDGYVTSCGAVKTEAAIKLMKLAGMDDPRSTVSSSQKEPIDG